jgi:hypothetical protein
MTSYLCKVSVYALLRVDLLSWRDLTDDKNQLTKAMRAIETGTPACEQRKAGKTDKEKMSKIHAGEKYCNPLAREINHSEHRCPAYNASTACHPIGLFVGGRMTVIFGLVSRPEKRNLASENGAKLL